MEVDKILINSEKYEKDETIYYKAKWNEQIIIVKYFKNMKLDKIFFDMNNYLLEKDFPAYKILNSLFKNTNNYIIYEYLEGNDGFHVERNIEYFYDVGVLIGELHLLFKKYAKEKLKEEKEIIHNDLHSGNIIDSGFKKYIIDFNSLCFGYFFKDLLNIEYEIQFEKEKEIKEKAFIDGYSSKIKINYSNRTVVVESIINADKYEYERQIKRGDINSKYFNNLKKAVLQKRPTFIPMWCI